MSIELTRFSKVGGPLSKRISLGKDGKLVNDASACAMGKGTACRVVIGCMQDLADVIGKLKSSEALALGALRCDLADKVEVVTKEKLERINGVPRPDLIARTGADIVYTAGEPALVLIDFDSKAIPAATAARVKQAGGLWPILVAVIPEFADAARLIRASTSAGLYNAKTGKPLPGSDGVHVYVPIDDGTDAERFLRDLHARCWLAGFGWFMVSKSGALLARSIIDRMVGAPEHLCFEGGPVVVAPLAQDPEPRQPVAESGVVIDSRSLCPPLSIVENARLDELRAKEAARLEPEARKARNSFVDQQAKELAKRTGKSEAEARKIVVRQCAGILRPDLVLPFDDADLAGCTVADVLADPDRFEGETLADPLEGVDYGQCVAKILRRSDGSLFINSFAHGGCRYELKYDFARLCEVLQAADKESVVDLLASLVSDADIDPAELTALRNIAAERSGDGKREIDACVKATQQQRAQQRRAEQQERERAARDDPRPNLPAPYEDSPWLPEMDLLADVVGEVEDATPPIRDADRDMHWCRDLSIPHLQDLFQPEEDAT
jgi:hypothetical protein